LLLEQAASAQSTAGVFAVCNEVQRQLKLMLEMGVIQLSFSPWASHIVLVRKKDRTLRFCVDYCALNSVTKRIHFLFLGLMIY